MKTFYGLLSALMLVLVMFTNATFKRESLEGKWMGKDAEGRTGGIEFFENGAGVLFAGSTKRDQILKYSIDQEGAINSITLQVQKGAVHYPVQMLIHFNNEDEMECEFNRSEAPIAMFSDKSFILNRQK